MRERYIMRYYHPFPEAIPLSEAGCSRVTHPSATMNTKQAKYSPFDLHVLGVPPAFVLSQDQTLHKFVSKQAFQSVQIMLIANRSQLLCFIVLSDFSSYHPSPDGIDKGSSFSCLSSIVQFSRCSHCLRFVCSVELSSLRQLIYYTTSLRVCQEVFEKFFQKFFSPLNVF